MSESQSDPALPQVSKPISLIPVGLKEAALDSPSFRATAIHFSEQVDIIERWLDAYVRSTSKLVTDLSSFEESINTFLARTVPPSNVSEAVLDHDYTLLAMMRFGEGSREWWSQALSAMRKMEDNLVVPIRAYLSGESRNFKDARRTLEQTQKTFDTALSRYLGQSKSKEPSALREDAFQVHEARKAYLKASLDFCLLAPLLRSTIDKLLVKVSTDQWKEMRRARETGSNFNRWNGEMERVRGWSREMENSENVFRRELQIARREIAETVSTTSKPSRELDDYNVYTVPFLGSKGPSAVSLSNGKIEAEKAEKAEKQGWLFVRTVSGKPARHLWVRRWFFVKNGIFGWLIQGMQSGGVEESEKTGVLLCNAKPAVQEERRFCFEVKTKSSTVLLQAETQTQLQEWLEAFELAKAVALEASINNVDPKKPGETDPAFAITQPSIPEFAARFTEGHIPHGSDELGAFDRQPGMPMPSNDLTVRPSFDVSAPRRSTTAREDGESSRDHAARIMQKLDIHRRGTGQVEPPVPSPSAMGGIASLISASHNILPVYSTPAIAQVGPSTSQSSTLALPAIKEPSNSTLAPATLANPPAPTNFSKTAVVISGERGIAMGATPGSMMANLWGSTNWGYINKLQHIDSSPSDISSTLEKVKSDPTGSSDDPPKNDLGEPEVAGSAISTNINPSAEASHKLGHQKSVSVDMEALKSQSQPAPKVDSYPPNYPIELKTQEAQFRMLFPDVPKDDKLVLVFRATWNPNEQQEFPGRVYVTAKDIYFFSHHLGLVLISNIHLASIDEVTAAPGKECDFLFIHLRPKANPRGYTRITIKTFLEPLRLLQMRLNFLVDNVHSDDPFNLESVISELVKLEIEEPMRSPSMESWEDVSVNTPIDDGTLAGKTAGRRERDLRTTIHVERGLHLGKQRKEITKVQLPAQEIIYEPSEMQRKQVERQFDISAKALFHVLFGDKSTVFQLLYHERKALNITQGPWTRLEHGHMRRDFNFQIDYTDIFRRTKKANVADYQVIDVFNDHVCYVIIDYKTPWHLPRRKDFMLVSKIVITHVAKSKSKLAVYTKVEWSKFPGFSKALIEKQALDDVGLDATELVEVVSDQARRLGPYSQTKKAVQIFGNVGQQTAVSVFAPGDMGHSRRPHITQRTLTKMVLDTCASFMESVATSLMMWAFAVVRHVWKIVNANYIILGLLFFSALVNVFFTSKDTSVWWTERNAAKFMSRMGVGPNAIMSRAVYIRDLDEIMHNTSTEALGQSGSSCYSSFESIANLADLDASHESAGATYSELSTQATARRLRRTRQSIGSYRHDLLVAMRVVNNVEREIMRAEWENFLIDENSRCRHLQWILEEGSASTSSHGGSNPTQERLGKLEDLKDWHENYCGSCKKELQMIQER